MLHYSPSSTPLPSIVMEARAAWHMTTMHIIVRQDCHFQPCHFHV